MQKFITVLIMALIAIAGAAVALMMLNERGQVEEDNSQVMPREVYEDTPAEGTSSAAVEEIEKVPVNEDEPEDVAPSTPEDEILPNSGVVLEDVPLTGTKWSWKQTNGTGQTMLSTVPDTDQFVLTFLDGARMSSATDCNTIGGTYAVEGSSLSFSEMFTTLMYCENSQESEYGAQLREVEKYHVEESSLYLYLKNDTGVMVFEKME